MKLTLLSDSRPGILKVPTLNPTGNDFGGWQKITCYTLKFTKK